MVVPGDRVLVAVSGGPDSVALLAALTSLSACLEIDVCAAHLNHHLRGEEAQRDQACAQSVAATLGVRCVVGDAVALDSRSNLEARAREQRYAFLARVAESEGCSKIATGHTMDDQAETLLMRLLRGTGWDGLACIQPVRAGRIVRPLIECSRQQVLAFLKANALPSCGDSSNDDRRMLRNRVRHDVLPLLRSINPNVVRTIASTVQILSGEAEMLDARVRSLCVVVPSLPVAAIVDAPAALRGRLVRTWLRDQRGDLRRLTAAHIRAVIELALSERPSGQVQLPGGQHVVREYDCVRWRSKESRQVVEAPCELVPGSDVSLRSGWRIRALVEGCGRATPRPRDLWELAADADSVPRPLILRSARRGDRVRPLGMQGSRKLQDIFVDRKLPREQRWSLPVVEAAGEILWVPGVVRSCAALITSGTRSTLRLIAQKTGIAGA
jgi:tRNA(Ile)-lysidine synthase